MFYVIVNSMWKERIVDKDKMSKRRKSTLVFCLFGSLISWCFNGLNDKKICLELTTWLTYILQKYQLPILGTLDIFGHFHLKK